MDLLPAFVEQAAVHGPWFLFGMALLETCFVTGVVVPSGLATSAATVLALEQDLSLAPVVLAAGLGGFAGDSLGFWVGRTWGSGVLHENSRWRRRLGGRLEEVEGLFRRHPLYSVTTARLISFVRTVMPMGAGMSGLTYRRFLPYEIGGLVGWVTLYVGIGRAGSDGWQLATRVVGMEGALLFLAGAVVAVIMVRRRDGASSKADR